MQNTRPDVPTAAVGAVIWSPRGEVLLVKRGREPRKGEWSIPGGKVEFGETLRDALIREVEEETGLKIEVLNVVDVVDFFGPETGGRPSHHYVLIDFTARASGSPRIGSDAVEAKWVPPGQLDRYQLWGETRRVIEQSGKQLRIAD